jgi:hypothetical protein
MQEVMKRIALAAGAAAIVGLSTLVPVAVQAGGPVPGCQAAASTRWVPTRGKPFLVEGFANGPTCAKAVVTLVVRAPEGTPLWADASPVSYLMTFVEVKTRVQMTSALKEWIDQGHTFKSSADFPPWKKGAQAPESTGEFPFYPEAETDQEYYEQVRAEKLPVFCYVQGMESMSCLVLKDGGLTKIGVQTFPG